MAREAESAGFEAIFAPEFMNDALADCQVMAQVTSRIKVGTSIANIYLRHPAQVWKRHEFDKKAILCSACGTELTIGQYLRCGMVCPACKSGFNPGCRHHYHLYFET